MTGLPHLTGRLLRNVSRSFYLTLRILPSAVRPQVGLAYLLARATDTIADTGIVPVDQRLAALHRLRRAIQGPDPMPLMLGELTQSQGSAGEQLLLMRIEEVLSALRQLEPDDHQLIQDLLGTITSGQELDLTRFGDKGIDDIGALKTDADLDDYTYRVAGCVGEFWTRMCQAHLFPELGARTDSTLAKGVRFGKGLQLVNILRDLPMDLRNGRCYLPEDPLAQIGLAPRDLLSSQAQPRFNPLYQKYLSQARAHLAAGWEYTTELPRRHARLRLACAWPILIGLRTLDKLGAANVLDPGERVKVSRSEVRGILVRTVLLYPWQRVWQGLFPRQNREFREAHLR